jgi:hypothetical protein
VILAHLIWAAMLVGGAVVSIARGLRRTGQF